MSKKKSRLKLAQEQAESAIKKTNEKIGELGTYTGQLYDELNTVQELFDDIRNVPSEKRLEYEKLKKIRLNWKQQAEKINQITKMPPQKMLGKVLLV
jgi:DNA-binding protein H-NS